MVNELVKSMMHRKCEYFGEVGMHYELFSVIPIILLFLCYRLTVPSHAFFK